MENSSLEGSHVEVYFSVHWCPPCQSFTPVLVESYRKIKEAGQKFEVILNPRHSHPHHAGPAGSSGGADRGQELQGVPMEHHACARTCLTPMPWSPGLILFVDSEDDGKSQVAKQVIQPIAEKITAKYKAKGEAPLLFFMVEEDDMIDSLRDYTNLPKATGHGSLCQVHDGCGGDQPYHCRRLLNDS
uniref:Thioredoxin-like fold domain-containing protein n=1 Tax=Myotis myotis TaxID=51298 RepID=A0A7J7UPP5_MYOMY|nr:hypothetical protein mMyoMyo1_008640 [Myotis myotis]